MMRHILFILSLSSIICCAQSDYEIALENDQIGLIEVLSGNRVLAFSEQAEVFWSEDNGDNWNSSHLADTISTIQPQSVSFVNSQVGFLTTRYENLPVKLGLIFKTTDGGETWEEVYRSPNRFPTAIHMTTETQGVVNFYVPYSTTEFFFFDRFSGDWSNLETLYNNSYETVNLTILNQHVWISIYNENLFYHSVDNGQNWEIETTQGADKSVVNYAFVSEEVAYASGDYYNRLYKSTDEGASWERVQTNLPNYVEMGEVFFKNEDFGIWIGGMDCQDACVNYPLIKHTSDGGATWQDQTHDFGQEAGRFYSGLHINSEGRVFFFASGIGVMRSETNVVDVSENTNDNATWYFDGQVAYSNSSSINYQVYTVQGQLLYNGHINENRLNLSHLLTGLYFLKINGQGKLVYKY